MTLHNRTTKEVLYDHLRLRKDGDVEKDLQRNFSPSIILLTSTKQYVGFDGVRESAALLESYVPNGTFEYIVVRIYKEIGYLVWSADSLENQIRYASDSFLIKDGKIVVQTIYYHVSPKK